MNAHRKSAMLASLVCLLAAPAPGAVLQGRVLAGDGQPLAGAIVTLNSDERGIADSVYTDAEGRYTLTTDLQGNLTLRVRKRYHRDDLRTLELGAAATLAVNATLQELTDPKQLSDDHPALSHFSMIDFDPDESALFSRANFTHDCLSCHQLGNSFTRWPRTAASWVPSVRRMHGYFANADEEPVKQRSEILAQAFDGRLASSRPIVPADPLLRHARLRQWRLDGAVVPHDAEWAHASRRIFVSEMFAGEVLEVDLESGETRRMKIPADGMPPGGIFTRSGIPAPYGLTVARAPHSLAEGRDGRIYLTDSIGSAISVLDPKTREFRNFDVGDGALYPHTVRIDAEGIVWFSVAFSDQIGRFDPETEEMRVIRLPEVPTTGISTVSIPYGVAVNPVDGGVWYARLSGDKIGRIDPKTLEITEYASPVRGPRRQRFDASGNLWVVGFSDGTIAKIDVADWDAKVYRLPIYAPGEIPAPYALAIHPKTQDVWVNDTMLDLVWRFLASEERFVAYPMPLRGTYTRDFTFTDRGWACTSNNPIPAAALEGGVPELICIDPGSESPTSGT